MKKETMTEQKAKETPAGGVLVGKREGQTIIHDKGTQGGYFVGKLHKEGGIQGINKSTGQPIEVQGGEVIITAPAVADQSKREFEGEMLTNREILSKINEKGGGVSLENGGEIYYTGTSYNYGGKTMTDYEIMQSMNDCGCEDEYEDGGTIITYKNKYNKKYGYSANESHNLEEIAKDTGISLKGLQQIYNKGIGAYKTNPESVRPNVKSKEQWAMARVYSAVMGGKASKIDANELKMNYGGQLNLMNESKKGDHTSRDLNNYNDVLDMEADGMVGAETSLYADGGLIAPNGHKTNLTPEQYKLVRTPEFKAWFGDWENDPANSSKVVDDNGEPLVVYHGTYVENPFYIFDFDKADLGFHFGTYEQAKNRSETKLFFKGRKSIVNSFFLNIKTIFESTDIGEWEYPQRYIDMFVSDGLISESDAKKNGFYRLVQREENKQIREYLLNKYGKFGGFVYNNKYEGKGNSFIVLNPNQIKLADGTNTTFDNMNPDIRYDIGGNLKPYDANMEGDSADTMYKEGGGVGERLTKKVIQFNALNNGWYLETIGGYGNPIAVLYDKNGKEIKFSKKWEIKDKWSTYFEEIGIIGVLKDPNYPKSYHLIYKKYSELYADGGKVYKARYRIIDSNGRVKYTGGTETGSWFSLERAKELVNRANGEMIYEYNYNGDMLWEVFATGGNLKPYDANMDGDSADTIYKEGGGVDVVIEDGWKVTRYKDGKEIYKKEDKNYSHEILRNKRGEVQLSTIVLDSLHGESFNKTYSETIFEYFDSVDDAKKYVKENYDTMDSKPEKKEVQTLSAEVFEWDKVPTNYRNISKVKKVPFTNNPMDKGLDSIISPFLSKDDLRPVGMGINFDKNGITATDYHKLITLPYPNEKYEGIYDINRVKKIKADQPILIDGNYPNYEAIIPKSNVIAPYEVDVYKLLQYTKTAMNYANKITKQVSFKFGDNERIGFNGTLLSEVLTACLKLGHEKIYAFITVPNKGIVLSPNKDYELGNDDILLLMPVMLNSASGVGSGLNLPYGAEDIDYNRSLRAYYDFNDNEIHNADGSVAEFKMQYQSNQLVDDNYLALLSKMIKKNRINILEYVKVENGKMTATDLEISLIVKDVNMPNGIYEIVNNAPNITMNPIEDFPSERVFNKGEYETHWEQKRPTAFEFVTFSEVFEFYLDKLLLSVGKDDLRPVMSGICIKKTAQNEMFLVTTDAHTLCKINITEYCEFNKDSRELEYILPVKYLKDFVKLADGSLHFKCSMSNIFIEADNLDFIGRTIDGKYPNYDAVIPRDSTKKIVFDHVAMNKCLKSPEMTNLIAKYKGRKDILFDFFNIGNTLNIKVSERKSYNVQSELIEAIELCKIDFNYQEVESTLSLDQSAFLLMPSKDEFKENQYFSFRKEFFDVMLETITDTEVDCYFSEPNRPYVFPIDAIDYKKTLKVEKTKQQKLSKKDLEQIVELEDMKEVLESNELQEAIETLEMLIGTAKGKEKKEIKEALEILKMLNENN